LLLVFGLLIRGKQVLFFHIILHVFHNEMLIRGICQQVIVSLKQSLFTLLL
jgi:hypothetical protein